MVDVTKGKGVGRKRLTELSAASILSPPPLYTYDYEDVLQGQTYLGFYFGSVLTGSATTNYALVPFTFYSSDDSVTGTATGSTSYVEQFDLDFDYTVKVPAVMDGDVIFDMYFGTYAYDVGTNSTEASAYYILTLYHYDGSTETSLGTATTDEMTSTVNDGSNTNTFERSLRITVSPKFFGKGDIIRVNVVGYAKVDDADADEARAILYFDANDTEASLVRFPFKLPETPQ